MRISLVLQSGVGWSWDAATEHEAKSEAASIARRWKQNARVYIYVDGEWVLKGRCVYCDITGEAPYIDADEVAYP